MTYNETQQAIKDLKEEAGLLTLEEDIIIAIEKELTALEPSLFDTRKTYNQTVTSIENEIHMAKVDGLKALLEDKTRKRKLNLDIPASFIIKMVEDPDIEYPIMVKALTITFLNLQNGADKKKTMTILKGSLSNTFIGLHGMSKKRAGLEAGIMADQYFKSDKKSLPFNARKKGYNTAIYTDFGYILKMP